MRAAGIKRITDVSVIVDNCKLRLFHVRLVVLCASVIFLDGFDVQAISYAAPAVAAGLGLPRSALGLVFSAGVMGLAVGSLLFGLLADRVGRKTPFIFCTVLFGVGSLATVYTASLRSLAAARLIAGLGLGGATPIAITIAADYCPKRLRSPLIIITYIGFALGGTAAGIVSGALGRANWRGVFYIGGTLPILLAPVLIAALPEWMGFLLKQGRKKEVAQLLMRMNPECDTDEYSTFAAADAPIKTFQPTALFSGGRMAGTLLLWAVFFTSLIAIYSYVNWIPTLLSDLGMSAAQIVSITSAGQFGGIAGALIIARLLVSFRAFPVIAGGYLLAAIAFLGLFAAGRQYADLLAINGLLGVCLLGTQYGINATAAQIYPRTIRGTAVGWAIGIGRLGGVLGPTLAGVLLSFGCLPGHLFGFGAIPATLAAVTAACLSFSK